MASKGSTTQKTLNKTKTGSLQYPNSSSSPENETHRKRRNWMNKNIIRKRNREQVNNSKSEIEWGRRGMKKSNNNNSQERHHQSQLSAIRRCYLFDDNSSSKMTLSAISATTNDHPLGLSSTAVL